MLNTFFSAVLQCSKYSKWSVVVSVHFCSGTHCPLPLKGEKEKKISKEEPMQAT